MKFLSSFRQSVAARVDLAAEFVALAISASGATVAMVLGKIFLACVLGAFAMGVLLRLTRQRKSAGGAATDRRARRGGA